MFVEKSKVLEAQKKFQAWNAQLVAMVAEAWKIVLEMHIPEEASLEAKIRKLAVGVCNNKIEVFKVLFELNLKIIELELKSQPSTPWEVKEQREATMKDGVVTVDAMVVDCMCFLSKKWR